jgi:hypothetical protein
VRPRQLIATFDDWLRERELSLTGVVAGGAALDLLGIAGRSTLEVELVQPEVPRPVAGAARAFAARMRSVGEALDDDWLRTGQAGLAGLLPDGWMGRLRRGFDGDALRLDTLGRGDLLLAELLALCEGGLTLGDCLAMAPTEGELRAARPWVEDQDQGADWPAHVADTFTDLARRLGPGV